MTTTEIESIDSIIDATYSASGLGRGKAVTALATVFTDSDDENDRINKALCDAISDSSSAVRSAATKSLYRRVIEAPNVVREAMVTRAYVLLSNTPRRIELPRYWIGCRIAASIILYADESVAAHEPVHAELTESTTLG